MCCVSPGQIGISQVVLPFDVKCNLFPNTVLSMNLLIARFLADGAESDKPNERILFPAEWIITKGACLKLSSHFELSLSLFFFFLFWVCGFMI